MNRVAGGGGSRGQKVKQRRSRRDSWELEMEKIGTKRYAARLLLKNYIAYQATRSTVEYPPDLHQAFNRLPVEKIAEVAYGTGA